MPEQYTDPLADAELTEQADVSELPSNQTVFAEDPLVVATPGMPHVTEAEKAKAKVVQPKRNLWIGVGLVTLIGLVLAVVGIIRLSRPALNQELTFTSPTPSPTTTTLDPKLQQQLDDLEIAINGIDPTTQRFVFPPVNLELELEESRR